MHRALVNPSAYDAYLRGRFALGRFDQQGFESAPAYFDQALQLDPSFTAAAVWLAFTWDVIGEWGFAPPATAYTQARNAATRALGKSSSVSSAHAVLAAVHMMYDWDWEGARRELREAQRTGPATGWIVFTEARLQFVQGQLSEALRTQRYALSLDPLNPAFHVMLGKMSLAAGDLTTAEAELRRTIEISPTFLTARFFLGCAMLQNGQLEQAREMMLQETPEGGRDAGLAMVFHVMGKKADEAAAAQRFAKLSNYTGLSDVAYLYGYLGKSDDAFTWLERAYRARDSDLVYVKSWPGMERLRGDPRYSAFLRKMNLPE